MRREGLCDPNLGCPGTEAHNESNCWLTRLREAEGTEAGQILRRALDMRAALKLGIQFGLDDLFADELLAMLIIEEEQNRFENEKNKNDG